MNTQQLKEVAQLANELGGIAKYLRGKQAMHKFLTEFTPAVVVMVFEQLEATERERDELRVGHTEAAKVISTWHNRAKAAEAELARRDAAAGEPVDNPVLGYADSYRRMASRGVENVPIWSVITDLERNIAPLYTGAPPAVLSPEKITEIMQDAWNEFCDDTGCYPDDFEYQNEKLFFDAGRWAMLVAERISSLGAQQQKVVQLPAASVPHGWKLVPLKAFPSQWAAGQKAFDAAGINKIDPVYHAMVEAAPAPGGDGG